MPVTGVLGHHGTEKATSGTGAGPPEGWVSGDLVSSAAPRLLAAPPQEKPLLAGMSLQHSETGENTQHSESWHCTICAPANHQSHWYEPELFRKPAWGCSAWAAHGGPELPVTLGCLAGGAEQQGHRAASAATALGTLLH